jgi:tripeptide aminopeptidase
MNANIPSIAERFMRYVRIDTQSDPHSQAQPSTEKQKNLSRLLVQELRAMGVEDAELDESGYVYATIPSNLPEAVPVVCFCAHVDTAPDCSGTDVKPILHPSWDGSAIVLPDDPSQVITLEGHPYLSERIGDDIITASGKTLLGADDKAGVAVIMEAAARWMGDPSLPHGKIRLLFTPDEEIGRGVDKVNMEKLGADIGYTLDGSERGSLEDETFSADGLEVVIQGVSAHPGFARGKMVNALKVGAALLEALPRMGLSPETTAGRDGFIHPVHMQGTAESATISFILRDFRTARLDEYHALIGKLLEEVMDRFPVAVSEIRRTEQYRNMKEVLDRYPEVVTKAEEAIRRAGMTVMKHPVRGGTDGSRLSFMGLPCPNIFTGEMAFHSLQEYVSVQDMQKAVDTILHLAAIWGEKEQVDTTGDR